MAVEITRKDVSAGDLRAVAARTKDAKAARRMLAIALVLEGSDRKTAAENCGIDRQTLRDWVHRYNAEGIAGLANRHSAGRRPLLSPEQKAELALLVRGGLTQRSMGWCAGVASTSSARSKTASVWSCMSGRWASNLRCWGFAVSRCGPSTRNPTLWHRRRSKKLRRHGKGRPAGGGARQATGGLVSR